MNTLVRDDALSLHAQGYSNRAIASRLRITVDAVASLVGIMPCNSEQDNKCLIRSKRQVADGRSRLRSLSTLLKEDCETIGSKCDYEDIECDDPVEYDDSVIRTRIAKMRDAKIAYFAASGKTLHLPNKLAAEVKLE